LTVKTKLKELRVIRNIKTSQLDMPSSHYHDGFEIYYLIKGEVRYFLDNKIFNLSAGDIILIPPNTLHKTNIISDIPAERLLIDFTSQFFKKNDNDPLFSGFNSFLVENPQQYTKILTCIEDEFLSQNPQYEDMIRSLLSIFLISQSRSATTHNNDRHSPFIERIINYINENYSENISLDSLSDKFSISKNYLSKLFKSKTGFGINEYLNIIRIKNARHLIISTNFSMSKISTLCGFNDSNYFSTVFKKNHGMSPIKYRKLNKKH